MNNILIGIDAGGTKTVAAAYTKDGQQIATQRGAAGNVAADTNNAVQAIIATTEQLLAKMEPQMPFPLPLLCVGAAGVSRGGERLSQALKSTFGGRFSHICVISDAELALHAAHDGEDGLLIIAGTGSIGYRKEGQTLYRVGGWGHLLGDEGSAYAVAAAAIRAVTHAADRGDQPPHALWEALQNALGIDTLPALISYVYSHPKADVAALCRVVAACADKGDADACAILVQAGQELAQMTATLLSRAPVPHALPLALGGGLVTQNAIVRASLEDRLQALNLPVSAVLALREPTRGVLSIYRNLTNGGLIL
jgi:N-acetylglucosamine kinase-like BadF-type ATPase